VNDITALRRAVEQLLEGNLGPLLGLLPEDVKFEVAGCGEVPESWMGSGTRPVVDYFTALGALPSFWQIDYSPVDGQVIAWGRERFTVLGCGLEGESEFALVFDFAGGRIVRLQVIEDLAAFVREGGWVPEPEAA
jgi:hypothetical protein